jgi:2-hydroxychromene-2-carboxylate isomerase
VAKTVDFFYGIGSRYSYLAATRMDRLAADTGATVRWRPLWSTLLMQRRGMDPFRGPPASGQYEASCQWVWRPTMPRDGRYRSCWR